MRSLGGTFVMSVVAVLAASCASTPPAIPVGGSSSAVSALTGTWEGEYSSTATERYGSIRFQLAAAADTAHGDVLMQPRRSNVRASVGENANVAPPPPSQVLQISFVRASGDTVAGVLDPYDDPECRCRLLTRFAGRLRGDRIDGRYSTLNTETGAVTWGEWSVRRKP
jgi:hypothetical protein